MKLLNCKRDKLRKTLLLRKLVKKARVQVYLNNEKSYKVNRYNTLGYRLSKQLGYNWLMLTNMVAQGYKS